MSERLRAAALAAYGYSCDWAVSDGGDRCKEEAVTVRDRAGQWVPVCPAHDLASDDVTGEGTALRDAAKRVLADPKDIDALVALERAVYVPAPADGLARCAVFGCTEELDLCATHAREGYVRDYGPLDAPADGLDEALLTAALNRLAPDLDRKYGSYRHFAMSLAAAARLSERTGS